MRLNLKKPLTNKKITTLLLLMSLALVSFTSFAQQQWWFDIEIIAYKRNISADHISEQFDSGLNLIDSQNSIDVLSDFVHPDLSLIRAVLPVCFAEPIVSDFPTFTYQYDESLYLEVEYQTLIVEQPLIEDITDQITDETADETADETSDGINQIEQITELQAAVETEPEELIESDLILTSPFSTPLIVPEWLPPRILDDHACAYEPQENRQPFVNAVPKNIDGIEWRNYRQPYLLSQSSLELKDLAKDIGRKPGLTTLLHMGWRQQVFFDQGESRPLHLIAGRNYGDAFDLRGKPMLKPVPKIIPTPLVSEKTTEINFAEFELSMSVDDESAQTESIDLISKIQRALESGESSLNLKELILLAQQHPSLQADPLEASYVTEGKIARKAETELSDIWELDGKLKIFLRYIGRTPYLHIDGQLDYRAPVIDLSTLSEITNEQDKQQLQSFEFKQLRRVISKQLHYFDHPLFGLLVQIRRYDLPPPEEEVIEEVEIVE